MSVESTRRNAIRMIRMYGGPVQAKEALKRRIKFAEKKLKGGQSNPTAELWIEMCKEILEEIPMMGLAMKMHRDFELRKLEEGTDE